MENKKDVGEYLKSRLENGKKRPNRDIWDRVNTSLDEREHKKKVFLGYWIVGLSIPVLISLFLFINPSIYRKKEEQIPLRTNAAEIQVSPVENPVEKPYGNTSILDSLDSRKEVSKLEMNTKDSMRGMVKKEPEIVPENTTHGSSSENRNIDETFTVSKTYHYYNSKDGEQWTTTDKNRIDSLLSQKSNRLDSISNRKRDSLIP